MLRILLAFTVIPMMTTVSQAQVRSGVAFLKMLPGARMQSMASGYTGGLDEVHAMYANPAAAGFMREFQWSASYTTWIADVSNASFVIGKKFPTSFGRTTNVSFGLIYSGVPEFDSSDDAVPKASASDMLASLSIGQPLPVVPDLLSIGVNLKMLRSTLEQFHATSMIFDAGVMFRSPKFTLNSTLLPEGRFSAGVAITQMGKAVVYDMVGTPLPRNLRVGAGFYAGEHHGFQVRLLTDYFRVKHEPDVVTLGAEINWRNRFAINGGYNFNSDLMSPFSFGMSVQLDDIQVPSKMALPGQNKALRLDVTTLNEGEFFSRTYQGSVSHYAIGPEFFEFAEPAQDDSVHYTTSVMLKWDPSNDPDLFDNISYTVLLDQDSTKLEKLISTYDERGAQVLLNELITASLDLKEKLNNTALDIGRMQAGDYYWAVIAMDTDKHIRFAETNHQRIAHFYIPLPDIEIREIAFDYSSWITEDAYQGEIKIAIHNRGKVDAVNFDLAVDDSISAFFDMINGEAKPRTEKQQLLFRTMPILKAGVTDTLCIPWYTHILGEHKIQVIADVNNSVLELDKVNNYLSNRFYTIPKGHFITADTANVLVMSQVSIDMPIITDICFEENSTLVEREYLHKTTFDPPLYTLASRMAGKPFLTIEIQGFADSYSEDATVELANRRAQAVKDSLVRFGVSGSQISIKNGRVLTLGQIPRREPDADWVLEERRYVEITAEKEIQAALFQPIRHVDAEEIYKPLVFHSTIKFVVPVRQTTVELDNTREHEQYIVQSFENKQQLVTWKLVTSQQQSWLNTSAEYSLQLDDTFGRVFRTKPGQTFLAKTIFNREHRFAFPLQFAHTEPAYQFFWSRVLTQAKTLLNDKRFKMQFTGHACAIGSEKTNQRLSARRARRFHQGFVDYVEGRHTDGELDFLQRLAKAEGFGESTPLAIKRLDGTTILIGDNNSAIGRKLNRRIELVFSANIEMDGKKQHDGDSGVD